MSQHQNVLIILIDQLRADCVEGALAAQVNLPNIQAFRKEAMTFANHFSVTNPCGPSRASILTGKYAMNHRAIRNGSPLSHEIPNIASEVRKAGFDPLLFGYTDVSADPRTRDLNDPDLKTEEGLLPGMREVLEMRLEESYPWRADLKSKGYDIPDYSQFYFPISPDRNRPARPDDPPFYKAEDSDTAFLANELLKGLSVRTDQNWFAFATFIRPHPPLVAPEPYNKMYDPDELALPARMPNREAEGAVHPFLAGALVAPSMQKLVKGCGEQLTETSDADVQMLRSIYMGLASEVDHHIGRIVAFLKDTGQYDDTLIVLTADHGEMLGDHHMWGKQNIYDPAYRVPLIIRDPKMPAQHGQVVTALTESIDLAPTILDWLSSRIPKSMDGHTLGPFLKAQDPGNWRDCVHLELDFGEIEQPTNWQEATGLNEKESNLAILREERFKLVHFNGGLEPLLFDLENDPTEMHNLAMQTEHAATLLRLTRKLLSHRLRYADRTLAGLKNTAKGTVGLVA